MAVVRCPKHDIPYNDRNPRGCPACHAERQGRDADQAIMRELARASRAMPSPAEAAPVEPVRPRPSEPSTPGRRPPPVTQPPRVPVPEPPFHQRIWRWIMAHRAGVGFTTALAVAGSLLWVITRPAFRPGIEPPLPTGPPLPVPLEVHTPVEGVFARFGTVPPLLNPDSRDLARYSYGGLHIDVLNSAVYAITLDTIARAWKGNRVGVTEALARGALALLGTPQALQDRAPRAPARVGAYQVYLSRTDLPERTLVVEVRPPNGCYDVRARLHPRVIGRLAQGDGQVLVVARRGEPVPWVTTRIRIVSRALPGPYAGPPVCDPTVTP